MPAIIDGTSRARLIARLRASAARAVRPGPEAARSQASSTGTTGCPGEGRVTDPGPAAAVPTVSAPIVLDASALMAVLQGEPDGTGCAAVPGTDARLLISAGTPAEALAVAGNRGIGAQMAALVGEGGVEVVPVTAATAARVAEA